MGSEKGTKLNKRSIEAEYRPDKAGYDELVMFKVKITLHF